MKRREGYPGAVPGRAAMLACGLAISLAVACDGCRGGEVAELTNMVGQVHRDHAATVERWAPAQLRDAFLMGDGLRTGRSATAVLRVFPDTQLFVRPQSVIRFSVVPPEKVGRVKLETGEVQVETAGVELDIETVEGVARFTGGTRGRVTAHGDRVRFDVEVGQVRVEDAHAGDALFGAGEHFFLSVGRVVREPPERPSEVPAPASGAVASSPPGASAGTTSDTRDADASWLQSETAVHRFSIPAGETAVIHDPGTPTLVGLRLSDCDGPAQVEVRSKARRESGARTEVAVLRLPRGAYRYRVRCGIGGRAPQVESGGRLLVRRDAGRHRLPRRAADVSVDADGRKYSVRYQNRLPRVTFVWPRAPQADAYELLLQGDRGQRRHGTRAPRITLPAATLPEGEYRFRFQVPGGRRSPESVIRIAFDNTARAAYLISPGVDTVLQAGPFPVAGVALTGSHVSVQSEAIPVTPSGRFKTTVPALPEGSVLVVRVAHARGGVHYYLRH